jgi:superfamily I DNA/RNA helicase
LDLDVATIEPKSLNDHLVTTLSQPELPVDVDYVRIMSLFKSKGLTSDVVVIVGVVQDLLPHPPKLKWTVNQKLKDLEEQRRMFYVGLTRAKKELILSYFEQIDIQLGRKMRLPAEDSRSYISTKYSPFLPELGPSCPDPKRGEEY